MFYTWLALVITLSIVEILTVNLVSIWFVASGIIAIIISLITDNITIQITVFVILGLLFIKKKKNIVKKIVPKKEKTNLDRIIGMEGVVLSKITKNHPGEVKVDGKIWSAIADETIKEDEIVKILEINSTKIKVEKVKEW